MAQQYSGNPFEQFRAEMRAQAAQRNRHSAQARQARRSALEEALRQAGFYDGIFGGAAGRAYQSGVDLGYTRQPGGKPFWCDILGVAPGATQDEIKKAYRKLVMEHHPDKGGDAKKFNEIQKAYDAARSN